MECIQIHYEHHAQKAIPVFFKIYTDHYMEDISATFYEWVDKTRIYTGSSLCRYIRKKHPKIRALSETQYLNFLMSRKPYKKYF